MTDIRHGTYIGKLEDLRGLDALIEIDDSSDTVRVQFDEYIYDPRNETRVCLALNWHTFPRKDFCLDPEIDDEYSKHHGTYVGPLKDLKDLGALIKVYDSSDIVKVQFDELVCVPPSSLKQHFDPSNIYKCLGLNWHSFLKKDFKFDEGVDDHTRINLLKDWDKESDDEEGM